jgi:hypothetical protein
MLKQPFSQKRAVFVMQIGHNNFQTYPVKPVTLKHAVTHPFKRRLLQMNWLKTLITLGVSTVITTGLTVTVNPNARENAQRLLTDAQVAVENTMVQVQDSAASFAVNTGLAAQLGLDLALTNDDLPSPNVTVETSTNADVASQTEVQGSSETIESENTSVNTTVDVSADVASSTELNVGGVTVDTGVGTDIVTDADVAVNEDNVAISGDADVTADASSVVTTCSNIFGNFTGWLNVNSDLCADAEAEAGQ